MGAEKPAEVVKLHIQMRHASEALHSQAEKVYEMAQELEDLTKDTTFRYAG